MKMNKKALVGILSAVAAVILIAVLIVVLVQCNQEPEQPEDPGKTTWPEAGVYYYDGGVQEYTLTLNAGGSFALDVKGKLESGVYTLTDGVLALDFNAEGKETIEAALSGNVITLTYDGATMRFLKKVTYTVSFETNGGSAVKEVTVLNGKTVAKPADPTRDGYLFIGWYADSEFKNAFAFDAQPVTADTTIYARWAEESAEGIEYTVDFDLNYAATEVPAAVQTIGAKLYDLPVPERDGYEFLGWWISMSDDGEKLSFQYKDGMELDAHTTLYALWQMIDTGSKLTAPVVNIENGVISWNDVEGVQSYMIKILNEDGEALVDDSSAATTYNFSFADLAPGEYQVVVTARAISGEANNSEAVRFYTNKALRRVSLFNVIDSMLIYNTVEGADKYLITVVCGNPDHNHTAFDNGTSRVFNFANCTMAEEGIRFTVTAIGEGYAASTSKEFVYVRNLDAVEGLRFDDATQTVSWDEVPNAAYYMVSVKCGNAAHNHDFVNNGSKTSVSLKECASVKDGIVVKVYPVTQGYNSPAASEYIYQKSNLATPSDIRLAGHLLSWAAVEGATKYEVKVGDTVLETETNSCDLTEALDWVEGSAYAISVRALGSTESLWSDVITASYNAMVNKLTYAQSVLSWTPVIGAVSYELQINDGEIQTINDGSVCAKVALTREGKNVLKLRFVDDFNRPSEWATIEVVAHAVIFDTRAGSEIPTQYKAVGDSIELPVTAKTGYTFSNWYNVPGGPKVNGLAYTDTLFAESGAIVLYAYYTPNAYTVTYNYGEGGTGDKTSDLVYYEQNYQLIVPTPADVAGAFGGWYSEPFGMGVQYTDAKGNSLTPWNSLEGAELHAFWIDAALEFNLSKVNGKDAYVVTKGQRIALVDEITVPATYKGLPVAMVAGNAFAGCTNLKVINLPDSLEQISQITPFDGCTNLTAINVYKTDSAVTPVYSSKDGVLFENDANGAPTKLLYVPMAKTGTYAIPSGITEIPAEVLQGSALTKVVIPATVTKIGKSAFADSKNLAFVVFESSTTRAAEQNLVIEAKAFAGCSSLANIILPARLTNIALDKYELKDGTVITDNVDDAFAGCTNLTIEVAANNQYYKAVDGAIYSVDGKTLYYVSETVAGEFTVAAGTQTVAPGAFIGCQGITEVTIPNTVTLIGECAFYGLNANLIKVAFEGNGFNNVTIGKYAFRACESLGEIELGVGSRVAVLSEGAFYGCTSLTAFEVPATVTEIGKEAFRDCFELSDLVFANDGNAPTFGEDAFYNCISLESVTLPSAITEIPAIFGGCTSLVEINIPNGVNFTSEDGVLYNKDMTELIFFPQGKVGDFEVPATVTKIANGVFKGNNTLWENTLTLPAGLTEIGNEAFMESHIGNIVFAETPSAESLTIGESAFQQALLGTLALPANVTSIGAHAFEWATADAILLSEGIESLGDYAFYKTTAGEAVVVPASVKTIGAYCFVGQEGEGYYDPSYGVAVELTLEGSQLETIGEYAFNENPNVTEITIPASVKTIANYAFYASYVESLNFAEGSQLETIGDYAFADTYDYWNYKYGLGDLTLPASLTYIGKYAFENAGLTTLTFESNGPVYEEVEGEQVLVPTADLVIGAYAFTENELEVVNFSYNLVEIGTGAFKGCGSYSYDYSSWSYVYAFEVNFAADGKLAIIGESAFEDSYLNGDIVLPASLANQAPVVDGTTGENRLAIGKRAFYGTGITSVTFTSGTGDVTIGAEAFAECESLVTVNLPANLANYTTAEGITIVGIEGGGAAFAVTGSWSSSKLATITVAESENVIFAVIDGILYLTDENDLPVELLLCPAQNAGVDGVVTIPATVTKIHDNAFNKCTGITSVVFADNSALLSIGANAFANCDSIETLTLPAGVTTIGEKAFYSCDNLNTLNLPATLTVFNASMVESCYKLATIAINGEGEYYQAVDGVLFSADGKTLIYYPVGRTDTEYTVPAGVETIAPYAFANNDVLESVLLPAGLKTIGERAFFACGELTTVAIPNTVTLIDAYAFSNCSYLETLTFEADGTEGLTIGNNAFYYTSYLEAVELPARLTTLGDNVFYSSGLESVTFAQNSQLTVMGNAVFTYTDLVSVDLPAGLVSIGDDTFFYCEYLETVTFGEGLISIGNRTFGGATALTSVSFPASLKTMGINTFYYYAYDPIGCGNLTSVTFGENSQLEAIPAGTFAYSSLTSFEIPANVLEISDRDITADTEGYPGAFESCTALETVTFAEGTKCAKIGAMAFKGCTALKNITIPTSVSTIGQSAFEHCETLESIVIPETVTNFGSEAFSACFALKDLTLNTKATELPSMIFANCHALTEVTIPASVTSMGMGCFSNCHSFTAYHVADGNTAFKAVDGVLYSADGKTLIAYPPYKTDRTFTVPKDVTLISDEAFSRAGYLQELRFEEGGTADLVIGEDAFYNCANLISVMLPANLVEIGDGAFYYCDKLVEVYNASNFVIEVGSWENPGDLDPYNVYTPNEGESALSYVDDFVIFTYAGVEPYLMAYNGNATSLTLPEGGYGIWDNTFSEGNGITEIIIPVGYGDIGYDAFYGCSDDMIFLVCETSKPSDWRSSWNGGRAVVWGYDGAEHTYTFVTGCDEVIDPITTQYAIAVPGELTLDGFVFGGWYNNEACEGSALSGSYYSATATTLYAKWMTEEEWMILNAGSSFDDPYIMKPCTSAHVVIDEAGEYRYYAFTAPVSASYTFTVYNHTAATISDTYAYLYHESDLSDYLKYDDESGEGSHFLITYSLEAGETYYLVVKAYSSSKTGEFDIIIDGPDGLEHTYTFVTGCDTVVDPITSAEAITIPTGAELTNGDLVFAGWYTNESFEGNAVSGSYYSITGATFYAKWITQEDFDALYAGTSAAYAFEAVNGASHTIVDNDSNKRAMIYFKVTATEDVTLTISTVSGYDTVIKIFDNAGYADSLSGALKTQDGYGTDETLAYDFAAGTTYYIVAYTYYADDDGDFTVNVTTA